MSTIPILTTTAPRGLEYLVPFVERFGAPTWGESVQRLQTEGTDADRDEVTDIAMALLEDDQRDLSRVEQWATSVRSSDPEAANRLDSFISAIMPMPA